MKNILGLDLGTNSIGWALVQMDEDGVYNKHIRLGSRIIPMSQDVLGKFDSGVTESQTAVRTGYRGTRRLRQRCLLRRERLLRVLHVLGFLPSHFDDSIGWNPEHTATYGKFLDDSEPKIAWRREEDGRMQFIFMDSFQKMLEDFVREQPQLVADDKKIPLDWTLYYLRKKALSEPVSKQELAWILLSFNQKRGYYQLRGEEEEEENATKKEEYYSLRVVRVEKTEELKGKDPWYNIHLENGWIYRRSSRVPLDDWESKVKEFIVTTEYEEDGTPKLDKDGNVKRSFRAPKPDDWTLLKKRTEADIDSEGATVGAYIYDHLLAHPSDKIRGKLVRTIERKFYKTELEAILRKQADYIPELRDAALLEACARELYKNNEAHVQSLLKHDLKYLLVQDLIFYQRPLKSKKSLIDNCPYEHYEYVDYETGEVKIQHIKCIAKSNPYFQEFRLWQWVQNLRLYNRTGMEEEVTTQYLKGVEDYVRLFLFLRDRKSIKQNQLMKDFLGLKKPKGKDVPYPVRWNYVEDKEYPCHETRATMLGALEKAGVDSSLLDNPDEEYRLWHLLYSVEDKQEIIQALKAYADKHQLPDSFVEVLQKIPSFKKEYGAYSEKATKRLLSLMRMGSLWNWESIPEPVQQRIGDFLSGNADEKILQRAAKNHIQLLETSDFQGLPLWLACYIIYGRHSEAQDIQRWETPQQMQAFIRGFRQHSMRNPIVEQCVLETLRTVHDIWEQEGHIDEIHVELGRSMKSTADQRKRMTDQIQQNENTNLRIRRLLLELKNDRDIEDVRPQSPMQQDILRIYEEGALLELSPQDPEYNEISRISRLAEPTTSEMLRYKLWLDQKYISPYTGRPIPLSKLFTPAYQIEHIIPQARFFDDSFSNKVICEAEVNGRKTNMLAFEFIQKCGGEIVHCTTLGDRRILSMEEYKNFVNDHYAHNAAKKKKLLMDDIPAEFIERQMNDSRYIARTIIGLLSGIVREEDEQEATSKHVVSCSGGITDRLKKDWGLNDVWNHLMTPRFQRMNALDDSDRFGHWEDKEGKRVFQTNMPLELSKGFSKKRIDHRHHAMDALTIACASRQIISYLNNESAKDTQQRYDLRHKLCGKGRILFKPWDTFTQDVEEALQDTVVSFKNYVRVINKASNYYQRYDSEGHKITKPQEGNNQWAVRKPLHKETIFGHVNLRRIKQVAFNKALEQPENIADRELRKAILGMRSAGMPDKKIKSHFKDILYQFQGRDVSKVDVFYYTDEVEPKAATRKTLDETFDEKRILTITDTGIQQILLCYLQERGGDPKVAFSPEGIADMNEHIELYNHGRLHKPILKVRESTPLGEKFAIGTRGNKGKKFAEAQKGTNLYFAIYVDEEGKRSYETVPLNVVAERLKQGLSPVPETNEDGHRLLFHLSPNDLVYVPSEEEAISPTISINKERIYKMVSATGYQCFFLQAKVATPIVDKVEFFSKNKMEKALDDQMVKAVCWKIETDRLGNITRIIR